MNKALLQEVLKGLEKSNAELPSSSSCERLIKDGLFAKALDLAEKELASSPRSANARLCWVMAQLKLARVPISALSAPLEDVLPKLLDEPKLFVLSCSVFLELASALDERSNSRLAVIMIERALDFARRSDLVISDFENMIALLFVDTLKHELDRAEKRRDEKPYIKNLKAKLSETEKAIAKAKDKLPQDPVCQTKQAPRRKFFTSKAIIAKANQEEPSAKPQKAGKQKAPSQSAPEVAPKEEPLQETVSKEKPPAERKAPSALFYVTVTLVLLFGIGSLVKHWLPRAEEEPNLGVRLAMATRAPLESDLLLPADENSKNKNSGGALADLSQRFKQLSAKATKPRNPEEQDPSADPEVDQEALNWQGTNDSSSSADELDLEALPEQAGARPSKKINSFPADKVPNTPVEHLGGDPRMNSIESLGVESSGMNTKTPVYTSDPYTNSDKRTLDGSPVRAYEVEKFDPPLIFHTLTATEVLSAPSLLASSLAHLEPNTPVYVVGRMGKWLELRSKAGTQTGYIYAQDAVQQAENKP